MKTSILKKRILANLDRLPQPKIYEVIDFVEYLASPKNNWKAKFEEFIKKIDHKFKKVSYKEIREEIAKSRKR